MPTRCCWPPESSRGRLRSRPARPTSSIISRARASRSAAAHALDLEREGDVVAARRDAAAGRSSGTPCPCGGGGSRSARASETRRGPGRRSMTSPAVGSTSRERQRTSVDLPEPDRPMMMKISPWRMSRSTSRTAPTRPAAVELGRAGLGRRARDEALGVVAEQLPHIAAGELYRAFGRVISGPMPLRHVVRGLAVRLAGRNRPGLAVASRTVTCRPRPSSGPRWPRSRRPRRPRSSCRRGRPRRDHLVHLVGVDREVLRDLVGDRPFVLHAGPGVLPDLAMRLAAIVGGVGVHAPFRVLVAGGLVFRELRPIRPCTWPAPSAANRSTA